LDKKRQIDTKSCILFNSSFAAPGTIAERPHQTTILFTLLGAKDMSIQSVVDFSEATTPAERFKPAAEKILKGDPEQTVYNHYNSPCGQMSAGVWEGEVGQWKVNYTEHEYCEIVQGVSVLRDEEGNAKTLRAGDRFVIPAGFKGTWEVLEACRKIYVVFEQKA
jgi:uncharacterized cupin superfamily protein